MNWLFVAFGLLLSLAGTYSVYLGADINQRGQDWAQLVAGAVLVSGGAVTLALSMLMFKLDGLRKAFRKGAAQAPAIPEAIAVPLSPLHPPYPAMSAPMPPVVHAEAVEIPVKPTPPILPKAVLVTGAAAAFAAGTAAVHSARPPVRHPEMPPALPAAEEEPALPAHTAEILPEVPEIAAHLPAVPEIHLPPVPQYIPAQDVAPVPLPVPATEAPHFISDKAEAELAAIMARPPHHEPVIELADTASGPLDGDWLDQALSGDPDEPLAFDTKPKPLPEPVIPPVPALLPVPALATIGWDDALEDEVTREMSFARQPLEPPPLPHPVTAPESVAELPLVEPPRSDIIGRHKVGNVEYVMYANDAIEADDGGARQRFASMAELKAHLVQKV